ncbi:choline/ethanolaminephosphotransferase 1-like [Gigantopelta aegis]|uniref:choline/ethanolaminephosphotransferase 1-like n=1 Tax=Gigantopelta aegis TaxID=1735272 RepID=UPI001B88D037|nr:choline/ethanolaminephosphotransferase 1-like [Gigantopelta aegis]XP_041365544.1 choline/ethanolaminephosphotransferase 1-like [Gigantopelta aegis]XP_041365545.1 choline/ethanolaminephosphotransferase 1-like [Gigantopelta aegis]XP_041365547.1 choline/ethanolaminephosphotransferase 1-like [Gigantopelta aegis]
MRTMTKLLSRHQLQHLSEHKYSVEGTTLLEPMLQKYWNWLLEYIPLWWSPNAITLAGLFSNILSTSVLMMYSPDAKQAVPGWAYVICGLATFIYQSLDSIDGKQARRTNTSSPLGELFDHGADAITNGMLAIGISVSFKLGNEPHLLICLLCFQLFIFYCAHWQAYVSGTLQMYTFDVNEGHYYAIGVYFVTSVSGEQIWAQEVGMLGIQLKDCIIYTYIVFALLRLLKNFSVIFVKGGIGKDGSTVAGTSTIFPLFPIAIVLGVQVTLHVMSPSQVFHQHRCLYMTCFTMLATKVTTRLMLANLSKSEMSLVCFGLTGPSVMLANQYFNCILDEYFTLLCCFFLVTINFLWFSYQISMEICEHLNIHMFTISSKPPHSVKNGVRNGVVTGTSVSKH